MATIIAIDDRTAAVLMMVDGCTGTNGAGFGLGFGVVAGVPPAVVVDVNVVVFLGGVLHTTVLSCCFPVGSTGPSSPSRSHTIPFDTFQIWTASVFQ